MSYTKTNWQNNTSPAISAENLNKIENKIEDFSMIVDNIKDYVIDQGTSGIWTWRKWNSGIAECWGFESATLSFTTAAGGIYHSAQQSAVVYPSGLFIEEPLVNIQIYGNSNGYLCWPSLYKNGTKDQTPPWYAYRDTTINDLVYSRVQFSVMGRWK